MPPRLHDWLPILAWSRRYTAQYAAADGVAAAVKQAESLVAQGLSTAKRGAYASPVHKTYGGDLSRFAPQAMEA